MNYFIDFDHTLYNTNLVAKNLLVNLAKYISSYTEKNYDEILLNLSSKFKRGEIYDIYELITYFSKIYNFDENGAIDVINLCLLNGKDFVFEDSIAFLEFLKEKDNKIYIFSYNETKVFYQTLKITGSGLLQYVDGVLTSITKKCDLPVDFKNSIFIDDKPKDLEYIYNKKPLKIYRIRRPNDTYSEIETNLPIPEFSSLEELQIIL